MASLGHVAVGVAMAKAHEGRFNWKAAIAFATVSMVPDLDVVAFRFGISYGSPFGHRGATHSIAFAIALGVVAFFLTQSRKSALAIALTVITHPLLDALTDGGLGVAFFWPLTDARYFFSVEAAARGSIGFRHSSTSRIEGLAH